MNGDSPHRNSPVALSYSSGAEVASAKSLADALNLPFIGSMDPKRCQNFPFLLVLDGQGLSLHQTGKGAPGAVRADFLRGKAGYRREHGGGTGQLIAKAVGLKKTRSKLTVLDGTAGLGQDAFVLAGLGCYIEMYERSPIVHALLEDGLGRARASDELSPILDRMRLHFGSFVEQVSVLKDHPPDVIYLDPMFPHRGNSAGVKKEMAVFREIVGDDNDAPELLEAALELAVYRVVVKRPRKAEAISGAISPQLRIEGKSSRYDIYPLKALPA